MKTEYTTQACNLSTQEKERKGCKIERLFSLVHIYFNGIRLSKAAAHLLSLRTVVLVQTIGR